MSFLAREDAPVWRIAVRASRAAEVVAGIRRYMAADAVYDWGGGLIWLAVPQSADAGTSEIRRVIAAIGGAATLVRARDEVRQSVDVFEPPDPAQEVLMQRVKAVFDPGGILNPGRLRRAH
jgi:glycolate oxidase FAD binding subunit